MFGPSILLTISTRTGSEPSLRYPWAAALPAREGDDLSLGQLLPAEGGAEAETAGEDDEELLTLDVVMEDHLLARFEHVEACA
jgi:hypothetical protein